MARPTNSYDWATNANFAGGPDVGTPTKVSPPAATVQDGWRGNQAPPPQYQNWWQNVAAEWFEYFKDVVDADEDILLNSREIKLDPLQLLPAAVADSTTRWIVSTTGTPAVEGLRISTGISGQKLVIPIMRFVPAGATALTVDLLITPATKSGAGQLGYYQSVPDYDTPAAPTHFGPLSTASTSGTSIQVLTTSIGAMSVNSHYSVVYDSGTITSGTDVIHGARLTFNDPGPRNF